MKNVVFRKKQLVRRCGMWKCAESPVDRGITHLMARPVLASAGWNANIYPILRILLASKLYISTSLHISLLGPGSTFITQHFTVPRDWRWWGLLYFSYRKLKQIEAFKSTGWSLTEISVTGNSGPLLSMSWPIISSIKLSHICGKNCAKPAMDRNAVGRSSYIFSEICTSDNCMFYGSSLPETMFKS